MHFLKLFDGLLKEMAKFFALPLAIWNLLDKSSKKCIQVPILWLLLSEHQMVRGKAKNYLKLKIVFLKSLYQKLNENALSKSNFPKEKIESP